MYRYDKRSADDGKFWRYLKDGCSGRVKTAAAALKRSARDRDQTCATVILPHNVRTHLKMYIRNAHLPPFFKFSHTPLGRSPHEEKLVGQCPPPLGVRLYECLQLCILDQVLPLGVVSLLRCPQPLVDLNLSYAEGREDKGVTDRKGREREEKKKRRGRL